MTFQKDQIQTLIAEIDSILNKDSPRLPWVMSSEANQQRQVLEKTRQYLVALQQAMDTPGGWGTANPEMGLVAGGASASIGERSGDTAQQVLQALLQEMNYLRTQLLQPLRTEVAALHQERESLLKDVRQLELTALQGRQEPAGIDSAQVNRFLESLMGQVQTNLAQQVASAIAQLQAQSANQNLLATVVDAELGLENQPKLHPSERLEQIKLIQAQSDQLLLQLDSSLHVVFDALQQSIQSYQDSLSEGLDQMHGLGKQGEVIFRAFINHLAQQLGQGASAYLDPDALPNESGQARLLGIQTTPPAIQKDGNAQSWQLPPEPDSADLDLDDLDLDIDIDDDITIFQLDEDITMLQSGDMDVDGMDIDDIDIDDDDDITVFQTSDDFTVLQLDDEDDDFGDDEVEIDPLDVLSQAQDGGVLPLSTNDDLVTQELAAPETQYRELDELYESLFGADLETPAVGLGPGELGDEGDQAEEEDALQPDLASSEADLADLASSEVDLGINPDADEGGDAVVNDGATLLAELGGEADWLARSDESESGMLDLDVDFAQDVEAGWGETADTLDAVNLDEATLDDVLFEGESFDLTDRDSAQERSITQDESNSVSTGIDALFGNDPTEDEDSPELVFSETIASLADLLPGGGRAFSSAGQTSPFSIDAVSPIDFYERDMAADLSSQTWAEDAYIPAPSDEDLLAEEEPQLIPGIELDLDDAILNRLTADLSSFEGLEGGGFSELDADATGVAIEGENEQSPSLEAPELDIPSPDLSSDGFWEADAPDLAVDQALVAPGELDLLSSMADTNDITLEIEFPEGDSDAIDDENAAFGAWDQAIAEDIGSFDPDEVSGLTVDWTEDQGQPPSAEGELAVDNAFNPLESSLDLDLDLDLVQEELAGLELEDGLTPDNSSLAAAPSSEESLFDEFESEFESEVYPEAAQTGEVSEITLDSAPEWFGEDESTFEAALEVAPESTVSGFVDLDLVESVGSDPDSVDGLTNGSDLLAASWSESSQDSPNVAEEFEVADLGSESLFSSADDLFAEATDAENDAADFDLDVSLPSSAGVEDLFAETTDSEEEGTVFDAATNLQVDEFMGDVFDGLSLEPEIDDVSERVDSLDLGRETGSDDVAGAGTLEEFNLGFDSSLVEDDRVDAFGNQTVPPDSLEDFDLGWDDLPAPEVGTSSEGIAEPLSSSERMDTLRNLVGELGLTDDLLSPLEAIGETGLTLDDLVQSPQEPRPDFPSDDDSGMLDALADTPDLFLEPLESLDLDALDSEPEESMLDPNLPAGEVGLFDLLAFESDAGLSEVSNTPTQETWLDVLGDTPPDLADDATRLPESVQGLDHSEEDDFGQSLDQAVEGLLDLDATFGAQPELSAELRSDDLVSEALDAEDLLSETLQSWETDDLAVLEPNVDQLAGIDVEADFADLPNPDLLDDFETESNRVLDESRDFESDGLDLFSLGDSTGELSGSLDQAVPDNLDLFTLGDEGVGSGDEGRADSEDLSSELSSADEPALIDLDLSFEASLVDDSLGAEDVLGFESDFGADLQLDEVSESPVSESSSIELEADQLLDLSGLEFAAIAAEADPVWGGAEGLPLEADAELQGEIADLDADLDVDQTALGLDQIEAEQAEAEVLAHPELALDGLDLDVLEDGAELDLRLPELEEPETDGDWAEELEFALTVEAAPEALDSVVGVAEAIRVDDLPPQQEGASPTHYRWFLGLDIGSTGLSAVLMNQQSGEVYPLYWTTPSPNADGVEKIFRLPAIAYVTPEHIEAGQAAIAAWQSVLASETHSDQTSSDLPDEPLDSTYPGVLLKRIKTLMKVSIPHPGVDTTGSEPVLQWSESQQLPLQIVFDSLCTLLRQLVVSSEMGLPCHAVGLEDAELRGILQDLQGVVVGYPANWSDTYSFNIREAILTAGLVRQPEQIFCLEDAIATVLSGLPDPLPSGAPPTSQPMRQQTLYNSDWQGGTVVISGGAALTELGIVNLPQQLSALSHRDFTLRSFLYGGDAIDQDIICQLLHPNAGRATLSSGTPAQLPGSATPPSTWGWQGLGSSLTPSDWSSLNLDALELPRLGESDPVHRHRLYQRLESSLLGQGLLEATRYLKIILQHQSQFQLELGNQVWVVKRRDLESRILLPYIQRINRHLNVVLSQTGLSAQAINQVVCTGGAASLPAIARWLRQKFPNATIIQDTYPSDRPPSCSRVTYGLANLCRYPEVLDVTRQQYSDYFLLLELLRVFPDQPLPVSGIMHLLEQRGINTRACEMHILALLEGHLPPGLIPAETDLALVTADSAIREDYEALLSTPLFTRQSGQIFVPNTQQCERLRAYLARLLVTKHQSLEEPLIGQLAPVA